MSDGAVIQIIGAVIDVEFPKENLPKIYDALSVAETGLVLEVQQQLGDGVVRTIAMGPSEGLKRGVSVTNTGKTISVPVGEGTLGRIMGIIKTLGTFGVGSIETTYQHLVSLLGEPIKLDTRYDFKSGLRFNY